MAQSTGSIANEQRGRQPRLWPWAAASGLFFAAAFPPLGWWPLAWVAPAPFVWAACRAATPLRAAALGYVFGIVFWGALTPWIGATVVLWTHSPVGWLAWIGLTLIEALWFGLLGWLTRIVGVRCAPGVRPATVAALWGVVEWSRAQGPLAMPWGLLGYTQVDFPALVQVADLGGVYAVGFVVALFAASVSDLAPGPARRRARSLMPAAIVLAAAAAYGLVRLSAPPVERPWRVAAVQPNLTFGRWQARDPLAELAMFERTARDIPAGAARLVVWPESTAPVSAVSEAEDVRTFAVIARRTGAYQVVGTPYTDADGRERNSAAVFSPGGALAARYDKRWRVPYGEWTPLRDLMPLDSVFHYAEDLAPGTSDLPLEAGEARIAVLICYESVFPQVARAGVKRGADLIASITNDSWAGRSGALEQHAQMTRCRAVETRRWVVVAATTGITQVVSPTGRAARLGPYRAGVLLAEAGLRKDMSPYARWGDTFIGLCAAFVAACTWAGRRASRAAGRPSAAD